MVDITRIRIVNTDSVLDTYGTVTAWSHAIYNAYDTQKYIEYPKKGIFQRMKLISVFLSFIAFIMSIQILHKNHKLLYVLGCPKCFFRFNSVFCFILVYWTMHT